MNKKKSESIQRLTASKLIDVLSTGRREGKRQSLTRYFKTYFDESKPIQEQIAQYLKDHFHLKTGSWHVIKSMLRYLEANKIEFVRKDVFWKHEQYGSKMAQYLAQLESAGTSEVEMRVARNTLESLGDFCKWELERISLTRMQKFFKASGIDDIEPVVSAFFQYLASNAETKNTPGEIEATFPSGFLDKLRQSFNAPTRRKLTYSHQERRIIYDSLPEEGSRAAFSLLTWNCFRLQDILAMRAKDFDDDAGMVSHTGFDRKRTNAFLLPYTKQVLIEFVEKGKRKRSAALFEGSADSILLNIKQAQLIAFPKKIIALDDLRYTGVQLMYDQDVPVERIMKCGWTSDLNELLDFIVETPGYYEEYHRIMIAYDDHPKKMAAMERARQANPFKNLK
jgi:integrase